MHCSPEGQLRLDKSEPGMPPWFACAEQWSPASPAHSAVQNAEASLAVLPATSPIPWWRRLRPRTPTVDRRAPYRTDRCAGRGTTPDRAMACIALPHEEERREHRSEHRAGTPTEHRAAHDPFGARVSAWTVGARGMHGRPDPPPFIAGRHQRGAGAQVIHGLRDKSAWRDAEVEQEEEQDAHDGEVRSPRTCAGARLAGDPSVDVVPLAPHVSLGSHDRQLRHARRTPSSTSAATRTPAAYAMKSRGS